MSGDEPPRGCFPLHSPRLLDLLGDLGDASNHAESNEITRGLSAKLDHDYTMIALDQPSGSRPLYGVQTYIHTYQKGEGNRTRGSGATGGVDLDGG